MTQLLRNVLDAGFIVGLVIALFLGGKIVPYLIVVGVLPIILFWKDTDYVSLRKLPYRLFIPTLLYYCFCIIIYYAYTGLPSGMTPPSNPDIELYGVGLALLIVGYLRSSQIKNISSLFHSIAPYALLGSFGVLSAYMYLGIDGCRVVVAAAWPFIPALIFTTITFLLLLDWEHRSKWQKNLRLMLIALSIVISLAYTGSRGIAIAQFCVIGLLMIASLIPHLKKGLPSCKGLLVAVAMGLSLSACVGAITSCYNFARWPAVFHLLPYNVTFVNMDANANALATNQTVVVDPIPMSVDQPTLKDTSIEIRLGMWQVSLDAIYDAPWFGNGSLSLKPIIGETFGYEHNHNQYLAWLVTGGIVLLVIGLLFLSTPIMISNHLDLSNRIIIGLSITGLWGISMVFDAFFSLKFYLHYYSLILGVLFALVSNMKSNMNAKVS